MQEGHKAYIMKESEKPFIIRIMESYNYNYKLFQRRWYNIHVSIQTRSGMAMGKRAYNYTIKGEKRMEIKETYYSEVQSIAEKYFEIIQTSSRFSSDFVSSMIDERDTKLNHLLSAEKPKVMVYGIYNSGKSTLVNAICKQKVAEVADRPMTCQITEYDAGKYILIDSPGVNAPVQHEEIADKHLDSCHIILFVISSKGIFEDRENYNKLWTLIKRGIPFVIVLNDRGVALPSKEKGEALRKKISLEHKEELNQIKRKIIRNLIRVSGQSDVGDCYDVIVLNAKRAWTGVEKSNPILIEKSNLTVLTDKIDQILEGDGSLKQLLAPLAILEDMIRRAEERLLVADNQADYGMRRSILKEKIRYYNDAFYNGVRECVEKHYEELYTYNLNGKIEMDQIWDGILRDIKEYYQRLKLPLETYINKAFPEFGVKIDLDYYLNNDTTGSVIAEEDKKRAGTESSWKRPAPDSTFRPIQNQRDKVTLIDILLNLFKSKKQKEIEEYNRLNAEADEYNRNEQQRLEENIRRRQDARAAADASVNKITAGIRAQLCDAISSNLQGMIAELDKKIEEKQQVNQETQRIKENLTKLQQEIDALKKRIH